MITNLKDITVNSMIGMLPSVINYNNQSIRDSFNYIFDETQQCYIHDLINPTGRVESHWGKFVNLSCDTLQIKDASSFFNSTFNTIAHNTWANRFSEDLHIPTDINLHNEKDWYCHDIGAIQGLTEKLAQIDSSLSKYNELYKKLTFTDPGDNVYYDKSNAPSGPWSIASGSQTVINENNNSANNENSTPQNGNPSIADPTDPTQPWTDDMHNDPVLGASPKGITVDRNFVTVMDKGNETEYAYPKSILGESQSSVKKQALWPGDYKDLMAGKIYHYVDMTNATYAIVNNKYPYAFNTGNVGQVIYIMLERKTNNDFVIKLDSCMNKHVHVKANDSETTTVALICYKVDKNMGCYWKLYGQGCFGKIELK